MLSQLATEVGQRRLHPRELIESALRRIEQFDPAINAVCTLHAEHAFTAADHLAKALARGDATACQGLLAGLPLLIKDTMPVAGMRCTHGGHPLWANAATETRDDPAVARLRAAGAIIIGRTNAPSFGHTGLTASPLYGVTRNPWNLQRSPGGSSGGSAAALAAGLSALATSSDGGGSTRSPASLCGLVGYKPTLGLFGRGTPLGAVCVSSAGTMNATVEDALLEARVLAGPTPGDVASLPPGAVDLEPSLPVRVLACPSLRRKVDPTIRSAFEQACRIIERDLRLPVEWVERPFPDTLLHDFETLYDVETAQRLSEYREQWPYFEPSLRQVCENGAATEVFTYARALRRRHDYAAALASLVGQDAVLLTPVRNRLAPALTAEAAQDNAAALQAEVEGITNTMDFNMTGTPALTVPMGLDSNGVPMGLQIAAPRWRDGLAWGLALAYERAAPWPTCAPGYRPFGLD